MLNSFKANFLNKFKKFIPRVNVIQKLTLMGLVLMLACPTATTAMTERLTALWGRVTATRESRIGTAVALTAVGLATSYSFYRAFSEYYATQAQAAEIAAHADGDTVLLHKVASGDLAAIQKITTNNLNLLDEHGKTALIYAVTNGNLDLVEKLLNDRAQADLAGRDGFTPLMCLAQVAHRHGNVTELAEMLISNIPVTKTAYVNQANSKFMQTTALRLALINYDLLATQAYREVRQILVTDFIKLLLKYGVNTCGTHNGKLITEHPALKLAQAEIATDVDASKVVVVEDDNSGSGGATESKQELVGAAAVPENTPAQNLALYFRLLNETNLGPEQYANNWREVEQLLDRGLIDVNSRDEHGLSGLMIAIKNVNLAMVSCLLRHGADIRARTWFLGDDLTPMMFLAFADTTIVLYQEAHVLEIIKNINERELLLLQRDMCNGTIATAIYAPKSLDDQKFEELMQGAFPAEIALKFTRRYRATKYVIALFSKAEPFSFRKWLGFR